MLKIFLTKLILIFLICCILVNSLELANKTELDLSKVYKQKEQNIESLNKSIKNFNIAQAQIQEFSSITYTYYYYYYSIPVVVIALIGLIIRIIIVCCRRQARYVPVVSVQETAVINIPVNNQQNYGKIHNNI